MEPTSRVGRAARNRDPGIRHRARAQGVCRHRFGAFVFRVACAGVVLSAMPAGRAQTEASAWARRMQIRFSGYSRPTPLTDFPALVVLHEGRQGFRYRDLASPAGYDLRFMNATQTAELPYELERWQTNGSSFVWVRVDRIDGPSACIWMLWGNAAALAPPACTTNGAVWTNAFVAVWHLNPAGNADRLDSTTARHTAIPVNFDGNESGPGIVAGADTFESGSADTLRVPYRDALQPGDDGITVGLWLRTTSSHASGAMMVEKGGWDSGEYGLGFHASDRPRWQIFGTVLDGINTVNDGAWHHVAGTWDGTAMRIYVDGRLEGAVARSGFAPDTEDLYIASRLNVEQGFNGTLDEIRISRLPRSADWLWAECQTVRWNDEFQTYGTHGSTDTRGWTWRMKIRFSGYTRPEPLVRFPALIQFSESDSLRFAYNQFAAPATGADLRFTDVSGQTALAHEFDRWDPTGTSRVWVCVPSLAASSDSIWAYWGNPAARPPGSTTNGAVWQASYQAVWSFGEAGTARRVNRVRNPFCDAVPQGYEGNEDRSTGILGGCDALDGSDTLRAPGITAPTAGGAASLWIRTATANRDVYETTSAGWNQNGLWFQGTDLLLRVAGGAPVPDVVYPAAGLLDGRWHQVAATWIAGGERVLYVDGLPRGSQAATPAFTPGADMIVGQTWRNMPWIGDVDECRFASATRSASWIWAEWLNMASNHVFCRYGRVEPVQRAGTVIAAQ